MKKAIILISFAIALFIADSCSASRDVEYRSRTERVDEDGDVVRRERRIDDDGIEIKKRKRDRDIIDDEDEDDVDIKIRKERRNRDNDLDDEPAIIIKKEDR